MCDRLDSGEEEKSNNIVYHRFKKKLVESNYQINCRKCQQNPGKVLLQKKDVFCNDCLIDYCTKTFRQTLGKSRLIKTNDRILVGFSGGLSSIALVDLIRRGLDEQQFQKLRFKPYLLFIDESILDNSEQQPKSFLTKQLYEFICHHARIDCYFISLQCCINNDDLSQQMIHIQNSDDDTITYENLQAFFQENNQSESAQRFLHLIERFHNPTSRYDFLKRFKLLILMKIANHLNMDKVFVASTLNELSIDLINNISLGRGSLVPNEINFCDNRFGSKKLLRPLCELVNKELAFYLKFRHLDHLVMKMDFFASTRLPLKSSLHRLNEHFLTSISDEFPSTLHTVFKTGNKIQSTTTTVDNLRRRCKFCFCQLENQSNNNDEYSSYDALKLTTILSKQSLNDDDGDGKQKSADDDDDQYCYSCKRLANEINDVNDDDDKFEQFCILSID
ncbi:cytosolic thiouridylase subunit 2 [Dermatophagoides pteronyssinus]|uniref:cytosolic thiouridylase subunit 2 n=1 Tax=Dermatophagoides pteronyssinus TaxID=6956 RepID=UPI003F667125